jgi:hypothetical protein
MYAATLNNNDDVTDKAQLYESLAAQARQAEPETPERIRREQTPASLDGMPGPMREHFERRAVSPRIGWLNSGGSGAALINLHQL